VYRPVIPTPPTPPLEQLAAPSARKAEIRLYWRIVTRGLHPDLVAANVVDAHAVLSRCLPRERWEIEVAHDTHMNMTAPNGIHTCIYGTILTATASLPHMIARFC
jgi:hypothetical protein